MEEKTKKGSVEGSENAKAVPETTDEAKNKKSTAEDSKKTETNNTVKAEKSVEKAETETASEAKVKKSSVKSEITAEVETNDVIETVEKEKKVKKTETSVEEVKTIEPIQAATFGGESDERPRRGDRGEKSRKRRPDANEPKPESEWKERVVQIRRVTKVVKGGKKLSFRAIVIVGNQKGQVGVGCAKAAEVIIAIQKAITEGRKNLISVPIFKTTIPHPITGTSGAGSVMLRPASQGTGVIAGGAVRAVLELAGIENILCKSLGSKSPLNAANATLVALRSLRTFNDVAKNRGLALKDMLS